MIATLVANAAAGVTVALGALGLVRPDAAAALVSIAPVGRTGVSEVRATYGGVFFGLGLFCLLSQSPAAFGAAGSAWLAAAAARTLSAVFEGSREPKNLGGVVMELLIGTALVAGWR